MSNWLVRDRLVSHINKFVKGGRDMIIFSVFESFCYFLGERETEDCTFCYIKSIRLNSEFDLATSSISRFSTYINNIALQRQKIIFLFTILWRFSC